MGAFLHKGRTHIDATEAEMRWQLTMSLTFGARGLLYFYWTPSVNKVAKDGPAWPGIVMGDSSTDQPTEHWYQAKSLNSAVMALMDQHKALHSHTMYPSTKWFCDRFGLSWLQMGFWRHPQ